MNLTHGRTSCDLFTKSSGLTRCLRARPPRPLTLSMMAYVMDQSTSEGQNMLRHALGPHHFSERYRIKGLRFWWNSTVLNYEGEVSYIFTILMIFTNW